MQSWSALMGALAETRAAFDRANQAAQEAFNGPLNQINAAKRLKHRGASKALGRGGGTTPPR
jgi:hypothetical protein